MNSIGEIERKIHFFKIAATSKKLDNPSFELLNHSFDHIDTLGFHDGEDGRYLKIDRSKSYSMIVNRNNKTIQAKIGTRRTGGLPSIENNGKEKPLDLGEDDSLFEPSHFIIFSNGILGMEYNFFAPRAGSIRKYITDRVPEINHVNIQELYKDDATGVIASLSDIYKLEITAYADAIQRIGDLDESLHGCFRACKKASNGMEKISIEFWSNAKNDYGITVPFKEKLGNWLRKAVNREVVESFKVQGMEYGSEKAKYFDLLEDKFVSKKTVLKEDAKHRNVNSNSAFKAIKEAYDELEDELILII